MTDSLYFSVHTAGVDTTAAFTLWVPYEKTSVRQMLWHQPSAPSFWQAHSGQIALVLVAMFIVALLIRERRVAQDERVD